MSFYPGRLAMSSGRGPRGIAILYLMTMIWNLSTVSAIEIPGGDLTGQTVWDNVAEPYRVMDSLDVESGASLTIGPGVTVEFAPQTDLTVYGTLAVNGSATAPVVLTGMTKSPGSWMGLRIQGEGEAVNDRCSLQWVRIEYGGYDLLAGTPESGWFSGAVHLSQAHVTMRHCEVIQSGTSGLFAQMGSRLDVDGCHFAQCAGYPVVFAVNATLAGEGRDSELRRLTASGNRVECVRFAESFAYQVDEFILENTGLPYQISGGLMLKPGGSLEVEPGVTVVFEAGAGMGVEGGTLTAIGSENEPIVFTGLEKTPGSWSGLSILGIRTIDYTAPEPIVWTMNEGSQLSHVTIEYGGKTFGNLTLDHAKAVVFDSVIRHGGKYGVWHDAADGAVVERSQIDGNLSGGIYKDRDAEGQILAANNWWGDPSGPYHPDLNPTGAGDGILNDAATFQPFLVAPDQEPGEIPPSQILSLTATPSRWFVPADGVSKATLTIHVVDGLGNPASGYLTRLETSLGDVIDGDVTGADGVATAYVSSDQVGDALLTAHPVLAQEQPYRTAPTEITFTEPSQGLDVLPDAEAPYVNRRLSLAPRPIEVGVPVTITAQVVNPSALPMRVELNFAKHNYGLGLPLEIIDTVTATLPALGEESLSAVWTPLAPGHQCIGLFGTFDLVDGLNAKAGHLRPAGQPFELPWLHNTNPNYPTLVELNAKRKAGKTQDALDAFSTLSAAPSQIVDGTGSLATFVPGLMADAMIGEILDIWDQALTAIRVDPPRQDFRKFAPIKVYALPPIVAEPGVSQDVVDAANAMMTALLDGMAKLRALQITTDRYAGAVDAGETLWASRQASLLYEYFSQSGEALGACAQQMDTYADVLRNEGVTGIRVDAGAFAVFQDRLRVSGFTDAELAAAARIEMTSQELEAFRQRILKVDPHVAAAREMLSLLSDLTGAMRELAPALIETGRLAPSQRSLRLEDDGTTNNLIRIYETTRAFEVGNPSDATATIALRVRRLNLPSDWMARVDPSELTLGPGERGAAEVSLIPGLAVPQGTEARVAVEGYRGDALIGGVEVSVLIPVLSVPPTPSVIPATPGPTPTPVVDSPLPTPATATPVPSPTATPSEGPEETPPTPFPVDAFYKVKYVGDGDVLTTDLAKGEIHIVGNGTGTLKIKTLKKKQTERPMLIRIVSDGDLKKITSEAPVHEVVIEGELKKYTGKASHARSLRVGTVGRVKMTGDLSNPTPEITRVTTTNPSARTADIRLLGVILARMETPNQRARIRLSSKKKQAGVMESAMGALEGDTADAVLDAGALDQLSVKGGPIRAAAITAGPGRKAKIKCQSQALKGHRYQGDIAVATMTLGADKAWITCAGGNILVGHYAVAGSMEQFAATSRRILGQVEGGMVGLPGATWFPPVDTDRDTATVDNGGLTLIAGTGGERFDIRWIRGDAGVWGVFQTGPDACPGRGSIRKIQTLRAGHPRLPEGIVLPLIGGQAWVDPTLKPIKLSGDTQAIAEGRLRVNDCP